MLFKRSLPSVLTAYHNFVQEILAQLNAFGWTDDQLFGVHMALEESISNAIRHGNKHDPDKLVHVECQISPQRFFAKVCDEGCGYDPDNVPDCCADENIDIPGGRGLALIRAYMDSVEHSEHGRCVTMEKSLKS